VEDGLIKFFFPLLFSAVGFVVVVDDSVVVVGKKEQLVFHRLVLPTHTKTNTRIRKQ